LASTDLWFFAREREDFRRFRSRRSKFLKDVETLHLYLEEFEGKRLLVLVGEGPKIAPRELKAHEAWREIEVPEAGGVTVFARADEFNYMIYSVLIKKGKK